MKKAMPALFAVLLACSLTCPALAAAPVEGTPPPRQTAALYPAEVRETAEGDARRLEKIYLLSNSDDPAGIPTADFDREGWHYTLLDVTRQDNSETDTRDYTETVTLDSKSKDMDAIMPQLAATMEVTTEDGYTGTLTLDTASIKAEAAGYKSSSRTVTASRSYPNLSDADTSLIPKTIEDGGRTLTLADVQWQEAGGFYHASASYTGTATSKYATGYTVTAEYAGEVVKTIAGETVYTAIFSGTPITPAPSGEALEGPATTTPEPPTPSSPDTPAPTESPAPSSGGSWKWLLLLPVGGAAVGLAFLGKFLLKQYKAKKDWKEYTK